MAGRLLVLLAALLVSIGSGTLLERRRASDATQFDGSAASAASSASSAAQSVASVASTAAASSSGASMSVASSNIKAGATAASSATMSGVSMASSNAKSSSSPSSSAKVQPKSMTMEKSTTAKLAQEKAAAAEVKQKEAQVAKQEADATDDPNAKAAAAQTLAAATSDREAADANYKAAKDSDKEPMATANAEQAQKDLTAAKEKVKAAEAVVKKAANSSDEEAKETAASQLADANADANKKASMATKANGAKSKKPKDPPPPSAAAAAAAGMGTGSSSSSAPAPVEPEERPVADLGDVGKTWATHAAEFPAKAIPPAKPDPKPVPVLPKLEVDLDACHACMNIVLGDSSSMARAFPCAPREAELNEFCMPTCLHYEHYVEEGPMFKPFKAPSKVKMQDDARKLCFALVHPKEYERQHAADPKANSFDTRKLVVPPKNSAKFKEAQARASVPRKTFAAEKPVIDLDALLESQAKPKLPPPAPMGYVNTRDARISLSVDFAWASAHKEVFEVALVSDLASSMGLTKAAVRVMNISAGSTVVTAQVEGDKACGVLGKLPAMAKIGQLHFDSLEDKIGSPVKVDKPVEVYAPAAAPNATTKLILKRKAEAKIEAARLAAEAARNATLRAAAERRAAEAARNASLAAERARNASAKAFKALSVVTNTNSSANDLASAAQTIEGSSSSSSSEGASASDADAGSAAWGDAGDLTGSGSSSTATTNSNNTMAESQQPSEPAAAEEEGAPDEQGQAEDEAASSSSAASSAAPASSSAARSSAKSSASKRLL